MFSRAFSFMSPARRVQRVVSARDSGFRYNPDVICYAFDVGTGATTAQIVVAGSVVTGMRRVRGFTVDLDVAPNNVVAWALVYVPEGIPAANLTVNVSAGGIPGSFYTPEQHVICQGIAMNSNGSRTSSRFGRTLASNDQVYLLVKNLGGGDASVCAIIRFAVAFL